MVNEQLAILRRIFVRAGERLGSVEGLAAHLGVSEKQIRAFLVGAAMPSDAVLLRAVEIVLDDLPAIQAEFSKEAWGSLRALAGRR